MKHISLALVGAAALALTGGAQAADLAPVYKSPPVPAVSPISGYVGLYSGGTWWDNKGGSDCDIDSCPQPRRGNSFLFGGEGRVNWWVAPGVSLQVDAQAEGTTRYKGAHP